MQPKYGTDPEVFLRNKISGQFISAHGMFPGTKYKPYPVKKGAIQVDGNALEFNIDPARDFEEFSDNIDTVLDYMTEMVKLVDNELEICFTPVAEFDPNYFQDLPADAKILGCNPDFNIFGYQNDIDPMLEITPIRTAAGHIHLGFTSGKKNSDEGHFTFCTKLANHLYSHEFMAPKTDSEHKRLSYYGSNGAFRPKSYGLEYRAPSNLWVINRESRKEMFENLESLIKDI